MRVCVCACPWRRVRSSGFGSIHFQRLCLPMHVPDVHSGEGRRLMASADVARSDMSRLINLEFMACFGPAAPSVTDAAALSKVAACVLQLIFTG